MTKKKRNPEYERRFRLAARTAKWAVTMTKVRIRHAIADTPWPHWHLLAFTGKSKGESRGVVDLIAIRKDHGNPRAGMKRGDSLQIILIQVKGGSAAKPTPEDATRLRAVARRHGACGILLATWTKGKAARFYYLHGRLPQWREVDDLRSVFA
ncbi:MAG TPA: hypothetical protein VHX13_09225 [Acidobacteriaceae bacterium]|jgi:hypothetical protein|nr:hypothetical protein [Acidobacteriaceae bacterium]